MAELQEGARIALIHAVYAAMAPVEAAFQKLWPQVARSNLVDDALSGDLEKAGSLTPALEERIQRLTDYAIFSGASGVLFTCSAFGEAVAKAARKTHIPILRPNEAMFEAALRSGRRIGMIATFAPAVDPMAQEFHALASSLGVKATLETICIPAAIAAARSGEIDLHNRLVAKAAPKLAHCDAVMLAQFSTSTALPAVLDVLDIPVVSAPEAAVASLRQRLSH